MASKLPTYAPGETIVVPFQLPVGSSVSTLDIAVLDQAERLVMQASAPGSEVTPEGVYSFTVPEFAVLFASGSEMRVVRLVATMADGTKVKDEKLFVIEENRLVMWKNTAVSYYTALMLARGMAPEAVNAWLDDEDSAMRSRRLAAAFDSLLTLPITVIKGAHRGKRLALLTVEERAVAGLEDADLQIALGKAQVLEAAEVADADPTVLARRNGMVSMTVGESSQFYGTARPVSTAVFSREARRMLGRWLDYSVSIGRA